MPLYRGWAVVVACGIIASFSRGLGFYGLGAYLHALSELSAVNIGAQGAALAAMAAWPSSAVLIAASLVFGLGVGNLITFPPLLARAEFGPRSFGTVFGIVGAATQAGVALGPGLMGVLHDALGSYQPALWCLVTLEALAAAAVLWGRARRDDGGLEPTRGAAQALVIYPGRRGGTPWPGRAPDS